MSLLQRGGPKFSFFLLRGQNRNIDNFRGSKL